VEYGSSIPCRPDPLLRRGERNPEILGGYSTWWNMGVAYLAGLILYYGVEKRILRF
jgi:hypothetical protein